MKTRSTYSDRLDDLLAGLPPRDIGPRRAGPGPDEPSADEPPPEPDGPVPVAPARPPLVFGRAHLSALGIVLVLILAVVAVILLRSRATAVPVAAVSVSPAPAPVDTAPRTTAASPTPGPAGASVPATSGPATIRVHVAGRVGHPDVYALPEGSRVVDALRAAGGLAAGAHPGALNLAAPVCDGCQVIIPASGDGRISGPDGTATASAATPAAGAGSSSGPGAASSAGQPGGDARIDLNQATSEQLQTLDGVGPATAAKIIAWRTQHGRFSDISELQEIDGIGPKTYARLKDHVRI